MPVPIPCVGSPPPTTPNLNDCTGVDCQEIYETRLIEYAGRLHVWADYVWAVCSAQGEASNEQTTFAD